MNPLPRPEHTTRLRRLFEELSELPAEHRSAALDRACRGDGTLRRELSSLLQQADTSSPRFDQMAQSVVQPMLHALREDPSGLNVLLDGMMRPGAAADVTDALVGRTISHFDILAPLGRGGMGVVYKARDRDLDRTVALKFLPPWLGVDAEAKARFIREARAASALDHVNIATVFEIGETPDQQLFIAMAYYEGETLARKLADGPLPVDRAVAIATQLADGLARAHARGVVHRDVKPGNILITPDGVVKLLDFGLAKLSGSATVTQAGTTAGTPAYMSPEQAGGGSVDHRTDIWSLGVVLFEMLTGHRPFPGDNAPALVHGILRESPPSMRELYPGLPASLAGVVERCLAKDPAQRPPAMADVLADLRATPPESGLERVWRGLARASRRPRARAVTFAAVIALILATGAVWLGRHYTVARAPHIDSLVVLPFRDLSGDPAQEHFVDGMQHALIGELSKIGGLRVISRQSTERYRNSGFSVEEIARELNVAGVLETSVLRLGDRVHLHAQLIGALPEERSMWSQAFEDEWTDVFALHNKVVRAIAAQVRVRLTTQDRERLAHIRTIDPGSYELYLKGMHHLNKSTPEDFARGMGYLHEAVDRNPAEASAYAGLALGYLQTAHSIGATPEARSRARAAAERALRLDPTLADVHVALANLAIYLEWDVAAYEAAARRAFALDPNSALMHYHQAWYHVLHGRLDEALEDHHRAQSLDPLTPLHTVWIPGVYWCLDRHEDALTSVARVQHLFPDDVVLLFIEGMSAAHLGKFDLARERHELLAVRNPQWSWALGYSLALAGQTAEARSLLAEWEAEAPSPVGALALASIHAALGNKDEAFRWIEHRPAHAWMPWLRRLPMFETLRDDPRMSDILRRHKLPQ